MKCTNRRFNLLTLWSQSYLLYITIIDDKIDRKSFSKWTFVVDSMTTQHQKRKSNYLIDIITSQLCPFFFTIFLSWFNAFSFIEIRMESKSNGNEMLVSYIVDFIIHTLHGIYSCYAFTKSFNEFHNAVCTLYLYNQLCLTWFQFP